MVSVLIPNYSNESWLTSCIESCLAQGDLLHEIIVVDDHSLDGSLQLLKKLSDRYPQIIKVFSNPSKGANSARNFAFSQCTGQHIQWLDGDDFLLPEKFEIQLPPLMRDEADIIYSDWRMDYWSNGERVRSEDKFYKTYPDFLLELIKENWTSPNNYLMNRKTAEQLHNGIGWNPNTKVGQDREYFTLAGILGARFKYVSGTYAVYNKQEQGTISGMEFSQRLVLNQVLEERFRTEILKHQWIPSTQKNEYLDILNTHKLKACFYVESIELSRPINPFRIKWKLMHWKMRLVMPFIFTFKHLEYFVRLLKDK